VRCLFLQIKDYFTLSLPSIVMLSTSTRSESSNAYSRSTSEPIRLIWHRHDLRLHDNELYSDLNNEIDNPVQVSKSIENVVITQSSTRCVSLFVFDTTYFKPRPSIASAFYDTVWTGPHAARVLIDAVSDLRNNLASIGGKLLVRVGDPTIIVPQIAQEIGATEIFYNEEPGTYENEVSRKVKECYMGNKKCKIETKVGYTLNHPNDLPLIQTNGTNLHIQRIKTNNAEQRIIMSMLH